MCFIQQNGVLHAIITLVGQYNNNWYNSKNPKVYTTSKSIHYIPLSTVRHRRSIMSCDRLISLVSSRFKRASTFLCVLFQSRQDEQNENGPILRDSRLVSSNLARTCSSHLILPVLSWFKRAGTFLHVSFQNNETRMANKCSTAGVLLGLYGGMGIERLGHEH